MSDDERARIARPRPAHDVTSWDDEADVVIVGIGAAGACAAIEARHAGASVLAAITSPRAGSNRYLYLLLIPALRWSRSSWRQTTSTRTFTPRANTAPIWRK